MTTVQSIGSLQRSLTAHLWIQRCQKLAQGRFWPILLTTAGCLGNVSYTCTLPFVCVGIITGTTLTRQKAVVSTLLIWLANQVFGYTLHQYPRTLDCFAWGLVLGVATLLVSLGSSYRPLFTPSNLRGNYLWILFLTTVGFLGFQGLLLLAGLFLESHSMTLAIYRDLWLSNLLWTGGILAIHALLIFFLQEQSYRA
jgi:hypothetical protein